MRQWEPGDSEVAANNHLDKKTMTPGTLSSQGTLLSLLLRENIGIFRDIVRIEEKYFAGILPNNNTKNAMIT